MQQTFREFLDSCGVECYHYLSSLYAGNPDWKEREWHAVGFDGQIFYGLRSKNIEKYLIKRPVNKYRK